MSDIAKLGLTKHRFVLQYVLFLCIAVIGMEAVSRMDNSSFVATNDAILKPAYAQIMGRFGE